MKTNFGSYSRTKPRINRLDVGGQSKSLLILMGISIVLFGGIGWRLMYLQIEQGEANKTKAYNNHIRTIPKSPIRGNIFDRRGKLLAATRLSHTAYLWARARSEDNWQETKELLSSILNIPQEEIQKKVELADINDSRLIPIARNLTPQQVTTMEEYRDRLKWVETGLDQIRHYPQAKSASHIIGYTGELNPEELKRKRKDGYRLGDTIGKMGIESSYENLLRGEWGGIDLKVDGRGNILEVVKDTPALPGQDITLTIDIELQKAAERALGWRKGAMVVLNPKNGEVLALASNPRFDPNIFSSRISSETWKQVNSGGNPFVNRAVQGFPPASTFKIVTQTAGMESGKYPYNSVLRTYGSLNVMGTRFREWNRAGFGSIGYITAMGWSSNTFHGQIGRGVGGETLIDWARKFGFGSKTGIELPEESPGLIADDSWKRERFKNLGWTIGDTINMSIGQGFTSATPLQVAVMFSAVANNGYKVQPHLLKPSPTVKQPPRSSLNLKPSTVRTLQRGLRAVVTWGTGKRGSYGLPAIGGKTGTAEAPPRRDHAWFGAYAPFYNPEVVVVAFTEHSGRGGGGKIAAPIVNRFMRSYFYLRSRRKF